MTTRISARCPHCENETTTEDTSIGEATVCAVCDEPFIVTWRLGDYDIQRLLGRGGMGVVYFAQHTKTGQPCALKVLSGELAENTDFLVRFRREIATLAKFNHPNIVHIVDAHFDGTHSFYAMEYVDGSSVAHLINKHGAIPWEQVVDFAIQICRGLKNAHDNGVVHRDLKPDNLLVDRDGLLKIADFGIARSWESQLEGSQLTSTGAFIGTPEYMSPEQAQGETATAASDVYSLGTVLYTMLTGRPPFQAASFLKVCQMVINDPVPPLCERNPRIPEELQQLIYQALEKKPDKRVASAYALLRHLEWMEETLDDDGEEYDLEFVEPLASVESGLNQYDSTIVNRPVPDQDEDFDDDDDDEDEDFDDEDFDDECDELEVLEPSYDGSLSSVPSERRHPIRSRRTRTEAQPDEIETTGVRHRVAAVGAKLAEIWAHVFWKFRAWVYVAIAVTCIAAVFAVGMIGTMVVDSVATQFPEERPQVEYMGWTTAQWLAYVERTGRDHYLRANEKLPLKNLVGVDWAALPDLLEAVTQPKTERVAHELLEKFMNDSGRPDQGDVEAGLQHTNETVRLWSIRLAVKLGPDAAEMIPQLLAIQQGGSERLAEAATESLIAITGEPLLVGSPPPAESQPPSADLEGGPNMSLSRRRSGEEGSARYPQAARAIRKLRTVQPPSTDVLVDWSNMSLTGSFPEFTFSHSQLGTVSLSYSLNSEVYGIDTVFGKAPTLQLGNTGDESLTMSWTEPVTRLNLRFWDIDAGGPNSGLESLTLTTKARISPSAMHPTDAWRRPTLYSDGTANSNYDRRNYTDLQFDAPAGFNSITLEWHLSDNSTGSLGIGRIAGSPPAEREEP